MLRYDERPGLACDDGSRDPALGIGDFPATGARERERLARFDATIDVRIAEEST